MSSDNRRMNSVVSALTADIVANASSDESWWYSNVVAHAS